MQVFVAVRVGRELNAFANKLCWPIPPSSVHTDDNAINYQEKKKKNIAMGFLDRSVGRLANH